MVGVGVMTRQRNSRKAKTKCLHKMNDILKVSKMRRKAVSSVKKGNKTSSEQLRKLKSCKKKSVRIADDELFVPSAPGSEKEDTDDEFVLPLRSPPKKKSVTRRRQSMEQSQERLRSIIDSKISDDESGGSDDEECSMRSNSASLGRSCSQSQDRMDGSRDAAAYRRKKLSCRNFSSSETSSQSQSLRPTYLLEYFQRVKTWNKKSEAQTRNSTQSDFKKDNISNNKGDQDNEIVLIDSSDDDVIILD